MCPFGSSLLVGMASGGIRRLQIGSADPATRRPKLVEVSGALLRLWLCVRDCEERARWKQCL